MSIDNVTKRIHEAHLKAKKLGLHKDVNVINMYQAFYEQDKYIFGSYKDIKQPEYSKLMQQRYDRIFEYIDQTLDSRALYKKEFEERDC